ncbi:hypothetical protein GGS23DRAFT_591732 [Durotheca rogersii]|uniref:uncharacterized protein n=1 Tax=Durotheca rogersii TaxID=419775 RepID=UPI00222082D6|nr:uncharacterized protein GGS23DRAFT_591732 [Durotheca rogersii]KAI5867922.1 hypothetical protein GGS23DRAFT_591732 [Durotheca rogersii]
MDASVARADRRLSDLVLLWLLVLLPTTGSVARAGPDIGLASALRHPPPAPYSVLPPAEGGRVGEETEHGGRPVTFGPTLESARANGPAIFNAVHDAMRQFGSSLHHNGMSLIPAIVPAGVLLYHGTDTTAVPSAFEWLAFEIEHAEAFAHSWGRPPATPTVTATVTATSRGGTSSITSASGGDYDDDNASEDLPNIIWNIVSDRRGNRPPKGPRPEPGPGYLQVYQATRPLNVLYIDGTAAGKTRLGTLDTQDLLLRGRRGGSVWDDWDRARDLCALGHEGWGIDGFVRMEPGFEIVYCDFSDGLRLVSADRRPGSSPGEAAAVTNSSIAQFEWARAAAQRYRGIGAARVRPDYSAMVSAFFYPLNLTNPDPARPDLPRLLQASDAELRAIADHISRTVARSTSRDHAPTVDWQGVTDMIVARYVDRLPLMAQTDSLSTLRGEVNTLLNVYIDYSSEPSEMLAVAERRCASFYLQPVQALLHTVEDRLISAAIENTAARICAALFQVRRLVVENAGVDESELSSTASLEAARGIVSDLMERTLLWAQWKECGTCHADEVCLIAMWPIGDVEDHFNPSCRNLSAVGGRRSYWTGGDNPPPPPPPSEMSSLSCADRGKPTLREDLRAPWEYM